MKVANIIIAHKNPSQLLRLINQYDPALFHCFVHIDSKSKLSDFVEVARHRNVTMLSKRRRLVYAGYGFVQATLDAFDKILASDEHYFYINVMSGLDFPIRSTKEFYDFLLDSYHTDKKEFFEILDLSVWPGEHRYRRYHLIEWTIKGRYFTERIINRLIKPRQFYSGRLTPYGRAAWFTATDRFVRYAVKFLSEHPDFIRFLKTTWSPDEFIFNTIVMNSPFKEKVSHYLRYIDWSEKKVTPKLLRMNDLDALIASGCFLARKLDEGVDAQIIDALEKIISTKKNA